MTYLICSYWLVVVIFVAYMCKLEIEDVEKDRAEFLARMDRDFDEMDRLVDMPEEFRNKHQ